MPTCLDCGAKIRSGARCQMHALEHSHGTLEDRRDDRYPICPACQCRILPGVATTSIDGEPAHVECRGQVRCDGGVVRGIEPGDVCIDLAQGTTVQVVDVAAETVDEWQRAHDYDLLGNYANERLGAMHGEPVFTCVYANSIRSEPSKTYDFPASRLARVEHEKAHGERVQDVLAIELLADLFETANANTDDPWPGDLDRLARDAGVDLDVLRAASELGETRVKERDSQ